LVPCVSSLCIPSVAVVFVLRVSVPSFLSPQIPFPLHEQRLVVVVLLLALVVVVVVVVVVVGVVVVVVVVLPGSPWI
jgi:hypothetical protein